MSSCSWGFFWALVVFLQLMGLITAQKSQQSHTWQTLSGNEPLVVAKGGFSGLFPDSSQYAYSLALETSLTDVHLWCDVQLTKDGVGICLPDINLSNCTNIGVVYPNNGKVYPVNGMPISGYFSVDYTLDGLSKVSLIQGVFSRTDKFDGSSFILTVEDAVSQFKPPGLWLNIQHDLFYGQHNLSMRSYLLSLSRHIIINYVSSPEVSFLRSIAARFSKKTKLIFRFLEMDTMEPSTNQTYGALLKNLTFVKTFASGILVPKNYIWPVTADLYLQPHTSIVLDAHKVGLEVFASGFANDNLIPYNYSYDPLAEYLSFVDNGIFSVDGMLSDFPITASEATGCFSHINKSISGSGRPTIISHNGASGIYPGCTDLAYQQAVDDGADFIDCPVQVTKDNILVCMSSINLMDDTTVTKSSLNTKISTIPEIQSGPGIFTFNLTWEEIQKNLKPQMENPEYHYGLVRNPSYKNSGNFMKLSDFLAFAKGNDLSGVLISVEYAAFLAEKMDFSITDAVIKALHDSGYDNQTGHQVMIQSANSSVLIKFKDLTDYKLVYKVDETIGDALSSSIQEISNFAHSVAIDKQSIYPQNVAFITGQTNVVNKLQHANLSVYVYLLRNEFLSQAWDFFSDPIVEINSFVEGANVDGIITDFPRTASAYRKNTCSNLGDQIPNYMKPVQPGGLLTIMPPEALPPASAAFAPLSDTDVVESALPPASINPQSTDTEGNVRAPGSSPSSSQPCIPASILVNLAILLGSLIMFV